jgi:hypothetical protein
MKSNHHAVKACPFCGKQPKVCNDSLGITVMCTNQDCPARFMGEIVIAAWNKRDGK